LSYGGRLVLINSVLSSLALFMMSFFELPKGILHKLDYFRSRFFWQGDDHKKKYRLAQWHIICRPKEQGGLGILDLDIQNKCLLSKWLYKLINEDGAWQQLLRNKYLSTMSITQVGKKPGDSQFWIGLMNVKNQFLTFGNFRLQNGTQIRFWEDIWLGNSTLRDQYPNLYNIVRRKNATVSNVLSTVPYHISFRRALVGHNLHSWNSLVLRMANIHLNDQHDVLRWSLTRRGEFSVRSMYNAILNSNIMPHSRFIWEIKLPLKVKIFLWFLFKGVTLTKDNLVKRNWHGTKNVVFVTTMKLYNTFSLIAFLFGLYGEWLN
jgi:hypothetical protein